MRKSIMYVEGLDGQIELMEDRVVIQRKGLWNMFVYGLNARREIPLSAVSEVVFKPAGGIRFGEIEFVRSGRSQDETSKKKWQSNSVKFNKKQNAQFDALKEKIFELIEKYNRQKA